MKIIPKGKNIIISIIMVMMIISIFVISGNTYATINPSDYEPGGMSAGDVSKVQKMANPIIGTIKTVGIVVAVITLIVLGVKYMAGSVLEKAEYKKTMIPYLLGAVMTVAITQLLAILIEMITNIH